MSAAAHPIVLAVADDDSSVALVAALEGAPGSPVVRRSTRAAAAVALRTEKPQVVVTFLQKLDQGGAAHVAELVGAAGDVPVLVAIAQVEKSTLVNLIKVGATDVLELPLVPAEVTNAITSIFARRAAEQVSTTSRIWAVFGAGGGCGVTSLSVNLAERLAHLNKSVALADLNLEMGDVSVFLNMKPRYTLTDVVQNAGKLDGAYLAATVAAHSSGLRVLAAPREIEDSDEVTPARLKIVFRQLRNVYDHLVLDTPSIFNETTVEALDQADGILLVTMLNIPSVRNAKRIRTAFDRLGYPIGKIRMVINRFEKKTDISVDEASALVGLPVFHTIPNDYPSVIRAINVGEPVSVVSPRSLVTRAMETLAEKLKSERPLERSSDANATDAAKTGWFFNRKPGKDG